MACLSVVGACQRTCHKVLGLWRLWLGAGAECWGDIGSH